MILFKIKGSSGEPKGDLETVSRNDVFPYQVRLQDFYRVGFAVEVFFNTAKQKGKGAHK